MIFPLTAIGAAITTHLGDRFTEQDLAWEVVTVRPSSMGGKNLRARGGVRSESAESFYAASGV